jgi:hypothetical protein
MSKCNFDFTRHIATAIILAFLISTALSCTTTPPSSGPELGPVPLPAYKAGTTFIYSDGAWETVTATSPGMVTWINHRGVTSSGSPDFTYRAAKWQGRTAQGTRQFTARKYLMVEQSASLWPLKHANAASYSETGSWQRKGEPANFYLADWSCRVEGTEQVSVMAGEFDAWKIVCTRYSVPGATGTARARETKTWYYSPEIEHYVLMTSSYYYDRPSRRQELLAVLPPNDGIPIDARRKMSKSFQLAMEFKKSGESVLWSGPQAAVSGEIIPKGTFKLADGSYSRRYVHRLNLPEGQRTYYGMAVRDSNGVWSIPRR